jgi:hypothetical protein
MRELQVTGGPERLYTWKFNRPAASEVHMSYWKFSTSSLAVLFILGCAAPEPPPKKTVFDPVLQPIQRARDVQNTVMDQAEEQRKAADKQERGEASP